MHSHELRAAGGPGDQIEKLNRTFAAFSEKLERCSAIERPRLWFRRVSYLLICCYLIRSMPILVGSAIMKIILAATSLVLCTIVVPSTGRAVNVACCNTQFADCMGFCERPEGKAQGKSCPDACKERVSACRKSGFYYWRSRPAKDCTK
jgi:hypothetical protein